MSITKESILAAEPRKVENIDGLFIGSVSPLTQSRRESMLRDPSGQVYPDAIFRSGIYSLIDQVCTNQEGDAMFDESDYEALCAISDSRKLTPLFAAVEQFNARNPSDPNGKSG